MTVCSSKDKVAAAVLSAGILIATPTAARCQRLAPSPVPWETTALAGQGIPQRTDVVLFTPGESRRTYWLEGGIVGGVLLGLVGYSMGSACPANTGSCPSGVVGFGIGASVGFVIGAFIGDTMEKAP